MAPRPSRQTSRPRFADPGRFPSRFPLVAWFAALALPFVWGCGSPDQVDPEATPGAEPGPEAHQGLQGTPLPAAMDEGAAHLQVLYVPSSGFAYPGSDGELTGVTVELLRGFGRWLEETRGLEVEMRFVAEERWATFYQAVREAGDGVLGIGNVTITEERREEIDFSPPYLANVAILMTHEEVPELQALDRIGEAFQGLTGLLYPGTLHETRMEALRAQHFPEMPTAEVASNDELVGRVSAGDAFGYVDIYNYWRAVEAGAPLRHHPVGDDASETFGVILPRGSTWTPLLAEYFEEDGPLVESDAHRELLREHLGTELADLLRPGG